MTEAEWLECKSPDPMIRFLELGRKTTCRKLRLFGVACCRRMWRFLNDERIRQVVEAAEGYADGLIDDSRLRAAHRQSSRLGEKLEIIPGDRAACVLTNAAIAADWVSVSDAWFHTRDDINRITPGDYHAKAAGYTAGAAADAVFHATYEGVDALEQVRQRSVMGLSTAASKIWAGEEEIQTNLLRCVVGNIFRPVPLDPAWRTPAVLHLAQSIYDDRAFDQLPILADALEEAGCSSREVLDHCRGPGPHVRGCWVVDLVLGKG
jgi:hypothetical protein